MLWFQYGILFLPVGWRPRSIIKLNLFYAINLTSINIFNFFHAFHDIYRIKEVVVLLCRAKIYTTPGKIVHKTPRFLQQTRCSGNLRGRYSIDYLLSSLTYHARYKTKAILTAIFLPTKNSIKSTLRTFFARSLALGSQAPSFPEKERGWPWSKRN